jgi:hypothetical protein
MRISLWLFTTSILEHLISSWGLRLTTALSASSSSGYSRRPSIGFRKGISSIYTSQPPQLARGELLIYLVRSRSESLWLYQGRSRMKNQGLSDQRIAEWVHKQPMVDPGHSGYTIQIGSEWLSEVYLNKAATNPGWVAALIFHEAMHNASRSRMSHGAYGQLSESDPKRSTYDRESVRKDVEKMAEWIASSPPPQWTEGFTIYREFNP